MQQPARLLSRLLPMVSIALAACTGSAGVGPTARPAGAPETTRTSALATAAAAVQRDAPVANLDVYLVGFHPMKDDPSHQFEAHHFCHVVNEELMQCALFDGNTRAANLTGVEYIISERLYQGLPRRERQYWHPHNGEILSGQLVAPGIPAAAEHALMSSKMNSYGKTWHTWDLPREAGRVARCRSGRRAWPGPSAARARRGPASWKTATAAWASIPRSGARRARTWCRSALRRWAWTACGAGSADRRSPSPAWRRRARRRRHGEPPAFPFTRVHGECSSTRWTARAVASAVPWARPYGLRAASSAGHAADLDAATGQATSRGLRRLSAMVLVEVPFAGRP